MVLTVLPFTQTVFVVAITFAGVATAGAAEVTGVEAGAETVVGTASVETELVSLIANLGEE